MRGMRTQFAAAWVLVGCAHAPPDGRSGADVVPDGARVMAVFEAPYEDSNGGKVSTPGGDRTDWHRVDLPARGGGPVDVVVTTRRKAGDGRVAIALYDEDGAPLASLRTAGRRQEIRTRFDAPPTMRGFYIVVQAVGWDDAARYSIEVAHEPAEPGPPVVELIEPLPRVPKPKPEPIVDEPEPEIVPCSAEWYRRGGTCNPPPPPPEPQNPPQPVSRAQIINVVVASGGAVEITLDVGTDDGVEAGMKGHVIGLKGSSFTISSVTARTSKARVKASIDDIKASGGVQLKP